MRGYLQQTSGMSGEITLVQQTRFRDIPFNPDAVVCRNYFQGCLRKDELEEDVAMGVTGAVFNSLPLEFTAYLDLLKYTTKVKPSG
jgi:hypothetical protein